MRFELDFGLNDGKCHLVVSVMSSCPHVALNENLLHFPFRVERKSKFSLDDLTEFAQFSSPSHLMLEKWREKNRTARSAFIGVRERVDL